MKKSTTVFITETDHERLGHLINMVRNQHDSANAGYVKSLEEGIEFAEVVAPEDIPPDVVTMRSRLKLRDLDSGEVSVYSIVFPTEANIDEGRISILAPLATALLGRKRGDTVEFQAPSRLRRLVVEEILYQPESSGDYNL